MIIPTNNLIRVKALWPSKLVPETKLPGSRVLSELLGVHRKTIVACYEELLLQGSRVKLPEWNGFWFYDEGKIKVFTKDNTVLTTPHIEKYNDRLDWQEMFVSSPEEIAKCMTQFDSTYKKEVD